MEGEIDNGVDIPEEALWTQNPSLLEGLLRDHTTGRNIIWATDDYRELGDAFEAHEQIMPELITGQYASVVIPRARKELIQQTQRVRDMAEVFTPTWICNQQNNLVDTDWFGREHVFNTEYVDDDGTPCWKGQEGPISFEEEPSRCSKRSWQDYVRDLRMEITCGEGPYLASRYDRVTGELVRDLRQRVGLLDRKLRIVSENTQTTGDWLFWAKEALKATYGYEWQGDSLLLARETLLFTFLDYYREKFGEYPRGRQFASLPGVVYIISWNLWQMDGLKMVVPYSCEGQTETDLFGVENPRECDACMRGRLTGHIGKHCLIRDWKKPTDQQKIEFQSLISIPSGK